MTEEKDPLVLIASWSWEDLEPWLDFLGEENDEYGNYVEGLRDLIGLAQSAAQDDGVEALVELARGLIRDVVENVDGWFTDMMKRRIADWESNNARMRSTPSPIAELIQLPNFEQVSSRLNPEAKAQDGA